MIRLSTSPSETRKAAEGTRSTAGSPAAARIRAIRAPSLALLAAAIVIVLYRLLTPLAAHPLAHLAFERLAPRTGEWTAQAERIDFDPFALAFDLHEVRVSGLGGDFQAGARLARVNFSPWSLFLARPALDGIEIRGGALRVAPQAEAAIWSALRATAADMRIAAFDAELTEIALVTPEGDRTARGLTLHGTGIDFADALGSVAATASDAFGDGSRLAATLTAEPADNGARLRGTATVAQGRVVLGDWALTAPSAAVAVDASLSSAGVTASFALPDGAIAAADAGTPSAQFDLTQAAANVSWQPLTGAHELRASASLAGGGRAEIALGTDTAGSSRWNARFIEVPAVSLAPYALRTFGAEPAGGVVDIDVSSGDTGSPSPRGARVTMHDLRLAVPDPRAQKAIALLEQPDGEISMEIPLQANRSVVVQIVEEMSMQVADVGDAPFATLAALVGSDAAHLSTIEFLAGTSEPTAAGQASIAALAAALRLRARIGVQIEASNSAVVDRAALARTQVALHVTLATAQAEPDAAPGNSRAAEIDFASARVQDVLDEFARERLDAGTLAQIAASFPYPAAAPPSAAERVAYYRAAFEALVEREPIADSALRRLARFRTSVLAQRLAEEGIADSRVASGQEAAAFGDDRALVALPLSLEPRL